jgi:hypothetical protein
MPKLQLRGGTMRISVGIDIPKEVHWVTAIDADGVVQIDRKRREGKRHHQAVIALARRRVNVRWAVLQSQNSLPGWIKTAA